jgi:hypothetical protein
MVHRQRVIPVLRRASDDQWRFSRVMSQAGLAA